MLVLDTTHLLLWLFSNPKVFNLPFTKPHAIQNFIRHLLDKVL